MPRTRHILPLLSKSCSPGSTAAIPIGSRIVYVQGECSTKPTYDFVVTEVAGDGSSAQVTSSKYCGTRNGDRVGLWGKYQMTNTSVSSNVLGKYYIEVASGTGVSLQVFYSQGIVDPA